MTFVQQFFIPSIPSISVITRYEVVAGSKPERIADNRRFLLSFNEIDVTSTIADNAGRLDREWKAKGYPLQVNDLLIGTTALDRNLTLITANQKHFPYLREVQVEEVEVIIQPQRGTKLTQSNNGLMVQVMDTHVFCASCAFSRPYLNSYR